MSTHPFTRMVASGLLATAIGGGAMTPSQSMPLPVTSVQAIAGAAPTEPVRWRGYGWGYRGYGWGYGGYRGYGWGWRRPNYGGAIAAGVALTLLLVALNAVTPFSLSDLTGGNNAGATLIIVLVLLAGALAPWLVRRRRIARL